VVSMQYALEIRRLRTVFPGSTEPVAIVDGVSLSVRPGEMLAVVGESGSGKSMTFLSALGLVASPGRVESGQVLVGGRDLLKLSPEGLRATRGQSISMIFQDPLSGLNPVFTVGEQIIEVLRAHRSVGRTEARREAVRLLDHVQIPDSAKRLDDYPHQFSGGMRQRVLTAMAIAHNPKVLIADEPTTALDVTVQAQILELLEKLRREANMAVVLITHDMGIVARHADRMAVMYAGRIVEEGTVAEVFAEPRHPYTLSLLRSIPQLDAPVGSELMAIRGAPPLPGTVRQGCPFEARCYLGAGRTACQQARPELEPAGVSMHLSACHFSDSVQSQEALA
jgi:oligopeptide/dipeptide ABC transporter ATP-binding protein